jgi:prepilin-type N-terminal cleavage/methylation domain-containing protein
MIRSSRRPQRGFTLIEMLVVMALIATLAAMAMVIVPGILEKDRSVDASTSLQSWLQIAQARAQRDRLPRGVRLIIDTNKSATTSPEAPDPLLATEAQYIESPPVFVANPNPNALNKATDPYIQFDYSTQPVGPAASPPAGSVINRQCTVFGLTFDQASQIANYASGGQLPSLWLPVLGSWHRITGVLGPFPPFNKPTYSIILNLDSYPDAQLGASTSYRTYHFGVYGPPRPLLGEPTMQLPKNTAVDLNQNVSSPYYVPPSPLPPSGVVPDYDILFAPNGHLAYTASTRGFGHVFLCVHEPRQLLKATPVMTLDLFNNLASIQQGGEMMIVAIKAKSGAIGVAPVDQSGGSPNNPYTLAQQAVAGP